VNRRFLRFVSADELINVVGEHLRTRRGRVAISSLAIVAAGGIALAPGALSASGANKPQPETTINGYETLPVGSGFDNGKLPGGSPAVDPRDRIGGPLRPSSTTTTSSSTTSTTIDPRALAALLAGLNPPTTLAGPTTARPSAVSPTRPSAPPTTARPAPPTTTRPKPPATTTTRPRTPPSTTAVFPGTP
jgi:hypothetical protein